MTKVNRYPYLPFLLVPIAGLSTDIYVPSMPDMMIALNCSMSDIQYSITFFVIGLGIAQLLSGPISDACGRKPMITWSMFGQLLAIAGLLIFPGKFILWMARFVQGICAGFCVVPSRAILNDCYSGSELKKKYTTMTTAFGLAPIIAPFIGGVSEALFEWQMSFIILMVYITALWMYVLFHYHETMLEPTELKLKQAIKNYKTIVLDRGFILLTLSASLVSTYNYICITFAPFLFQHRFGFSPFAYGNVALTAGAGWLLGNLTSRLLFSYSPKYRIMYALLLHGLLITACLFLGSRQAFSASLLIFIFFCFNFSAATMFSIFVSEALSLFPKLAASANGALFSFLWVYFGFSSWIASHLPIKPLMPMAWVFLYVFITSCTLIYGYFNYSLAVKK